MSHKEEGQSLTQPVYVGRSGVLASLHSILRDEPVHDEIPQSTNDQHKNPLSPAAQRALVEAEARRAAQIPLVPPKEIQGRNGPEPIRYGDWEVKGLASDF